jgi:hypothetical protein
VCSASCDTGWRSRARCRAASTWRAGARCERSGRCAGSARRRGAAFLKYLLLRR